MAGLSMQPSISGLYSIGMGETQTKVLEEILQKNRITPSDLHINNSINMEFISWLVHENVNCNSNVFIQKLLARMSEPNILEFYERYRGYLILKDICEYYIALLQLKNKEYSLLTTEEKNYLAGKAFEESNLTELAKYLDDDLFLTLNYDVSRNTLAVCPYPELRSKANTQFKIFGIDKLPANLRVINIVYYCARHRSDITDEMRKTIFQHINPDKYAVMQSTYKNASKDLFSSEETAELCILALNPGLDSLDEYKLMCKNNHIGKTPESYLCCKYMVYYYKHISVIYKKDFIKDLADNGTTNVLNCLASYLTEYNNRVSCEQIEHLIAKLKSRVKTSRVLRHHIREWKTSVVSIPMMSYFKKSISKNLADITENFSLVKKAIDKVICKVTGYTLLEIAKENTNGTIVRLIVDLINSTKSPSGETEKLNEKIAELTNSLSQANEKLKKYETLHDKLKDLICN